MKVTFFVEVVPERTWRGFECRRFKAFRHRPEAERRAPGSHLTKITLEIPDEHFEATAVDLMVEPPRAIRAVS